MPNRIIRDSIRTSNSLSKLTAEAERHFYRLMVYADDYGRFDARPEVILGACYPLHLSSVSPADVSKWTQLLASPSVGILHLYTVEGRPYGAFINWSRYQRIRNAKSKFPDPLSIDSNCPQPLTNAAVVGTVIEVEDVTPYSPPRRGILSVGQKELFDTFWKEYPQKKGKGAAEKAWKKLNPIPGLVDTMIAAVKAQQETTKWAEGYIPHPATWLNARRWEDEITDLDRKLGGNHAKPTGDTTRFASRGRTSGQIIYDPGTDELGK